MMLFICWVADFKISPETSFGISRFAKLVKPVKPFVIGFPIPI
jgi:hypothetical protein